MSRETCVSLDMVFVRAHCRHYPAPRAKPKAKPGVPIVVPPPAPMAADSVATGYLHPPGTPGRVEYPTRFELRRLRELVTSHQPLAGFVPDPRYPKGTQERDYEREPAEQGKVAQLAAELQPQLLLSRAISAAEGPPIITRKGNVVLSGNARTMGLLFASHHFPRSAERYRAALKQAAAEIGLRWPKWAKREPAMLVRVVELDPKSEEARIFALAANNRLGIERTETRRAAAMAASLPDDLVLTALGEAETLGDVTTGRAGRALREALWSAPELSISDKQTLFRRDGAMTDSGKAFLTRLLYIKALGDAAIVEELETTPQLLRTLEGSLPVLLRIRRDAERGRISPVHDATAAIRGAVQYWAQHIRPAGYDLPDWQDFFRQRFMPSMQPPQPSNEVRAALQFLATHIGRPRILREALERIAEEARGEKSGRILFRAGQPITFQNLLLHRYGPAAV